MKPRCAQFAAKPTVINAAKRNPWVASGKVVDGETPRVHVVGGDVFATIAVAGED